MEEDSKSYPTWINIILVLSGIIGIFREIPRIINNLMVTEAWYALIVGALSIFASICLICIANRKLWAFYAWILSAILVNLCMWLEPNISTEDIAVHMCAMIVHIFFLSILIFVPFKKGHSLYEAMEPFDLPLKSWLNKMHHYYAKLCIAFKKSKIGKRVASGKKHFSDKHIEVEKVIHNSSLPFDEYNTTVRKDECTEESHNYRINLDKITVKKRSSDVHVQTTDSDNSVKDKRYNRWGYVLFVVVVIVMVMLGYSIIVGSTTETIRKTYLIDENSVLHCSSRCVDIVSTTEEKALSKIISDANNIFNVALADYNIRCCKRCFGNLQAKLLFDSIVSYQKVYWGTTDRELVKEKIRRVEYLTNYFNTDDRINWYWNGIEEGYPYLRNFENFMDIYVNYFSEAYTPQDFSAQFYPGPSSLVDENLTISITNRILLFNWLLEGGVVVHPFKDFVRAITEPQMIERLKERLAVCEFEHCNADNVEEWLGSTPWDEDIEEESQTTSSNANQTPMNRSLRKPGSRYRSPADSLIQTYNDSIEIAKHGKYWNSITDLLVEKD